MKQIGIMKRIRLSDNYNLYFRLEDIAEILQHKDDNKVTWYIKMKNGGHYESTRPNFMDDFRKLEHEQNTNTSKTRYRK